MNHMQRADALYQAGRYQEALPEYERLLAEQPNSAQALYLRTLCLHAIEHNGDRVCPDRLAAIADDYSRVLAIEPTHHAALNGRGMALLNCNRFDEAVADFEAAITLNQNNASVISNLGIAFQHRHELSLALACFERALAINPSLRSGHLGIAECALLAGDYRMGLPHHEWRSPDIQHIDTKRWLGNHNISGKTIMLGIDGGYGDAIQFCRYVPMVKALGADIILYVPSDLFALMRNMPATITDRIAAPFDLSCPLQSLPLAFKTELHSIPNSCPYLSAPTTIVQDWAHRMQKLPRPRIGLCWSGHPTHKNDRNRSMVFADLRPMFEVNASFISLKNELSGEIGQLTESPVIDYRTLLIDFAQTAALIENLDLVITVDTSVAHLAGALGKPTWIMLPYTPDWRWMLDRDDSPWYPTARLFRQDSSRRWDGVVARVATELRCHQGHSREKPTVKSKETDERHQEPIPGSGS